MSNQKEIIEKYLSILGRIADKKENLLDIEKEYFEAFKKEKHINRELYDILEGVFTAFDACTTDKDLLSQDSEYYIDTQTAEKEIAQAYRALCKLL